MCVSSLMVAVMPKHAAANFHSRTVQQHLDIIKVCDSPTDAQENCLNPLNAELNLICHLLEL